MNKDHYQIDGQERQGTLANCDHYQRGLDLAEAGRHQDALEYMQEQLLATPDNAQVLNDTGAVLHCLGRSDEAIEHFVRAKNVQKDSPEIVWNLAEAYLAAGRATEAMKLFDDMERMGVLNADVLNRAATVFLNQYNKADAIEMLLRSLRIWSDQEVLRPMLEVIRAKRPKVALFGDDEGEQSLHTLAGFVEDRFQCRIAQSPAEGVLHELMGWSDISWFEQCPELAAAGAKSTKACRKVLCVRGYEEHEQWSDLMESSNIHVFVLADDGLNGESLMHSEQQLTEINHLLIELETEIESRKNDSPPREDSRNCASEEVAIFSEINSPRN